MLAGAAAAGIKSKAAAVSYNKRNACQLSVFAERDSWIQAASIMMARGRIENVRSQVPLPPSQKYFVSHSSK